MVNLNVPPKVLISRDQIAARCKELAIEIGDIYRDKNPLIIGTLTGSVFFVTDLLRNFDFKLELDFVKASSYKGDTSTGNIKISYMPSIPIKYRHVIIFEDIVDTGYTLYRLKKELLALEPLSLTICSLLDKPSRRVVDLVPDYVGFTIPDTFVVGYGLDYDNRYRNLPDICYFE